MALPVIRRSSSPIPIGLNPGFLSSGINLHARKAVKDSGSSITSVARIFAKLAIDLHRSNPEFPNVFDPIILFHSSASSREGPAAPFDFKAIF